MIGKKINQLATELAPASTDLTIIGNPTTGVSKKITLAQLGAIFSGAVSFYTNLASFPATGTLDVIFCAKDTQKLYLWSGSAYVEVFPSQALLDTYQLRSEKGNANGYASLDSSGKVPVSQLPSSIMEYKGTWSAATNTPTLANGTGDTGDVYICNAAGSVNFGAGAITFAVGDYVIYSGSIWQRSSGAVGTVTSVAASITGNAIGITGSPVTTSGTLAFAFAGTGAQYIKGDGTLATFPSTISQAEKLITEVYNSTGATLTKGTVVYINGGQGNLPTVTKALATGDSTSAQTFGIVQADITNMNNGYVVVAGKLNDLDTQAYTEGTQLYLSSTTAGAWTSTKQYAPAHLVYVGIVVRSHPTQGVVEVKIQNGYELDEIHNVAAQTPTNNDGLFYESSTSLWKNKSIATVLGYTPQAQLNGTGFVKASGTTITYDNSTYLTTSAAATTYLPMVLSSTAKSIELNGQTFDVSSVAGSYTSGRLIVTPTFTAIGYQSSGVFKGLQISTDGTANFYNTGLTRFFNQVQFDGTLTNGTYTYTLPGASGTLALTSDLGGYVPTSRTLTINGTAYDLSANRSWSVGTVTSVGLSSITSGVSINSTPITTSGTITLAIATASGSQQGLLSSTDWTTFNNKQNALTNPVTGTGTTNYLPKFTGTSTIGNSVLQDNGTSVTIASNLVAINGNGITEFKINNNTSEWELYMPSGGTDLRLYRGSDKVTFLANGNVGIGTSTPSSLLDVAGSSAELFKLSSTATNGSYIGFRNSGTLNGAIGTGANLIGSITNSDLGLWTTGSIVFQTNGSVRMRLDASGNLSIGNTNNTYKLDVTGTGRFTSDFTLGSGATLYMTAGDIQFVSNAGYGILSANGSRLVSIQNGAFGVTGAATFSSSVTTGSPISIKSTTPFIQWLNDSSTRLGYIQHNATNLVYNADTGIHVFNQAATFSSSVGVGGYGASYSNLESSSGTFGSTVSLISLAIKDGTYNPRSTISYRTQTGSAYAVIFDSGYSSGWAATNWCFNSGNVGIGTTSPSVALQVDASGGGIIRATRLGAGSAYIQLEADGTNGTLTSSAALLMNAGGSERIRITSGGEILAGSTSAGLGFVSASKFGSYQPYTTDSNSTAISSQRTAGMFAVSGGDNSNNQGSYASIVANVQYGASNNPGAIFRGYGNTTLAVQINYNGNITNTNNSYGAISDISLKENISDTTSKLADLLKVKIRNYNLIGDDKKQIGVIAQELETIFPSMIETNSEGLKSVKYSVFVPMLIKAIQELNDKIK